MRHAKTVTVILISCTSKEKGKNKKRKDLVWLLSEQVIVKKIQGGSRQCRRESKKSFVHCPNDCRTSQK